jgi:Flp pilus assembly pilin Flp
LGNESVQFRRPAADAGVSDICRLKREKIMNHFLTKLWSNEEGQDVAEYAVMLAVILVIVVGTVKLIGSNASNVFSQVGSVMQ